MGSTSSISFIFRNIFRLELLNPQIHARSTLNVDKTILWISVLLIVTGAAGVFLTYSGVSKTFEHGMQAVSALLLLMGTSAP